MRTIVLHQVGSSDVERVSHARALFQSYASALAIDLCFQGFQSELDSLPGDYEAPRGALLLAYVGQTPAGCCALRPIDTSDYENACEMKRLYVAPLFRGLGLGRKLAESMMDYARLATYKYLLLDTLDDMEAARGLYQDLGFEEVPPYYYNPIAGAHYLRVSL